MDGIAPDTISIVPEDVLILGEAPFSGHESASSAGQHGVEWNSGSGGTLPSPQNLAAGNGKLPARSPCRAPEPEEAYTLTLQGAQRGDGQWLSGMYNRSGKQYGKHESESRPEHLPTAGFLLPEHLDILPTSEAAIPEETPSPAPASSPVPEPATEQNIEQNSEQDPAPSQEPVAEPDRKTALKPITDQIPKSGAMQIAAPLEELEIEAEGFSKEATSFKKITVPPSARQFDRLEREENLSDGRNQPFMSMKLSAEDRMRRFLPQNSTVPDLLSGGTAHPARRYEIPFSLYLFDVGGSPYRQQPPEEDADPVHDEKGKDGSSSFPNCLRLSEAVKLAAQIHSRLNGESRVFEEGIPWYQVYLDYALKSGIVLKGTFGDFNDYATRAEAAYLLANALPERILSARNNLSLPPDVPEESPYSRHIQRLLRAGFLIGMDERGCFHPNQPITRTEAAVMLNRVLLAARIPQDAATDISD